jgi:hypothetical protein
MRIPSSADGMKSAHPLFAKLLQYNLNCRDRKLPPRHFMRQQGKVINQTSQDAPPWVHNP